MASTNKQTQNNFLTPAAARFLRTMLTSSTDCSATRLAPKEQ